MKKRIFWILILTMFVAVPLSSLLYAHDKDETGMMEGMKGGEGKGMMGGKMMGMHMMKMMMEKSVVATSDGGVVVVAGNKITKYNKNLDLVKEVEVKMDMEAMEKNMKEMMEKCPMMKDREAANEEEVVAAATVPSEHEDHH